MLLLVEIVLISLNKNKFFFHCLTLFMHELVHITHMFSKSVCTVSFVTKLRIQKLNIHANMFKHFIPHTTEFALTFKLTFL